MPLPSSSRPVLTEDWQNAGFGLYIHWPFCQSKCPYCDFNSHVADQIDQGRWGRAYLAEIDRVGALTAGRALNTVYFGGGTPSLMSPELVAALLEKIRSTWSLANDVEITLEANPSSVEAARFHGYRDAGVNRVSLGIQALNDEDLRRLGRLHSVNEAQTAFDTARSVFDRVSFDLIYARQGQTPESWAAELKQALAMAADHLSLYQLTIEAGTAFADRYARGRLPDLPPEDIAADMYLVTQELCDAARLSAYEVSNHAQKGSESRHNLIYWRYGDYAGIGPGAHGRVTISGQKHATETFLQPGRWLEAVESQGCGESGVSIVTRAEQAEEYLMMGLRLHEGISLSRYEILGGKPLDITKINDLVDNGLVVSESGRLIATPQGRLLLNGVLRELLAE